MVSPEVRVAFRHPFLIARHPSWWRALLSGGSQEVMREIVSEDLSTIRHLPLITDVSQIAGRSPVTILGRVGSPQEHLYSLIRWLRPDRVVETGVDRGISSAFILAALHDNGRGHLHSIDLPTAVYRDPGTGAAVASNVGSGTPPGFVIPQALRPLWSLHLGDSRDVLPALLERLGAIDFFLHDSEHTDEMMLREYTVSLPHIRPGGILASDDVNWNSSFQQFVRQGPFDFSTVLGGRLGVARVHDPAENTPSVSE